MLNNVLLRSGDVVALDSHSELNAQHLPEDGKTTGSPLWINWRNRTVYFSARRNGDCFIVLQSDDKG